MSGVNKVIIIGNLGRDPEMRESKTGNQIATLSIATSRKWKNKQTDEWQDETEWHRVTVFGHSAKFCGDYLHKGRQVYVEARLHYGSYENKDGVKIYTTDIYADDVQGLGARDSGGQGGGQSSGGQGGGGYQNNGGQGGGQGGPTPYDPGNYSPTGKDDDDIPF